MDWNLFWTGFGAIGTTLGSVVTAIAVVVAVRQYKEPLIKRLKIHFTSAIPVGLGVDTDLLCIGVSNTGIRPINISNIYFNVGTKDLIINLAQFTIPGALPPLSFPVELQPEQKIEMYIERLRMAGFFAENLVSNHFSGVTPVNVVVTDTTGGRHMHPTGCTVNEFASFITQTSP